MHRHLLGLNAHGQQHCHRLYLHLITPPLPPPLPASLPQGVFSIPFNSANKWALTVTDSPGSRNEHIVMMKGAPEIVLTKCSHYYHDK